MATGKSTWKRNKLLTARRNYFDLGGIITGATTAVGGLTSGVSSMVANASGANVKAKKKELLTQTNNAQMKGQSANDSFDSLAHDMATTAQLRKVNKYDLGAKSAGAIATESVTKGIEGAVTGFGIGSLASSMAMPAGDDFGEETFVDSPIDTGDDFGIGDLGVDMGTMAAYGGQLYPVKNKYMGGGPIGAIAGGVLGAGMSLIGNLINNHKAKKAAKEVNEQIAYTNAFNDRSMMNRALNLGSSQLSALEQNYAAYGGLLDFGSPIVDYDFMDRYLRTKELTSQGQDDSSVTTNMFAKGGGIHIKPSKRGTFTAAATKHGMGVQEFASKVLANKEDYSPAMVKKANFARNAAKWHAFGGELNTQGLDFTNGLLQINEGGSHEANPFEGVLMGLDQEGAPNLVEEGETIYNDYVFSNRLTVPKAVRSKYKLRGTKEMTFAEASKKMAKESEERPNDPISQRGLAALLNDLAIAQEEKKARKGNNVFANGGRVNRFDNGGWTPTAINKYGYIKDGYYGLGQEPFWIKNGDYSQEYKNFIGSDAYDVNAFKQHLKDQFSFYDTANSTGVGKGSNRYNAIQYFINSNPDWYNNRGTIDTWNIDSALMGTAKDLALSKPGFMHPETVAQQYLSAAANPGDPTSPVTPAERGAETRHWLIAEDEAGTPLEPQLIEDYDASKYTYINTKNTSDDSMDYTDHYYRVKPDEPEAPAAGDPEPLYLGRNKAEFLRYAPALGFGIASLTDALGLTNKPDYGNADLIMSATRNAYTPQVRFKPVGNYLAYNPLDREFYINQLNAQAGATRRALSQNAGLNRGAGLASILAADASAQNQLGLFARQAEEYNLGQRQLVERFNRETNMFNSEGFLKADIANQQAAMSGRDFALRGTIAAAEMRAAERARADAARSANLSGLFQTLGDIGYEAKNDNMVRRGIEAGIFGPGAQRVYSDDEIKAMERTKKSEERAARQTEKSAQREAKRQAKLDKEVEAFRKTGKMSGGLRRAIEADEFGPLGSPGYDDLDWLEDLDESEFQEVMKGLQGLTRKGKKSKKTKTNATPVEEEAPLLGAMTWYNPDLTVRRRKEYRRT